MDLTCLDIEVDVIVSFDPWKSLCDPPCCKDRLSVFYPFQHNFSSRLTFRSFLLQLAGKDLRGSRYSGLPKISGASFVKTSLASRSHTPRIRGADCLVQKHV